MSMTISEFLLQLATDPKLLRAFKKDADTVLKTSGKGLSPKQKALLSAGKLVDLDVTITAEFKVGVEAIAMSTIYVPPPPSPLRPPTPKR